MKSGVSENNIRKRIESTKMGRVISYTETPFKYDFDNKRVLMNIEWNQDHVQYNELKRRLESGDNIKIFLGTLVLFIYKDHRATNKDVWSRGLVPFYR